MKKTSLLLSCVMAVAVLIGSLTGCTPKEDFSYEAIDPGTLAAPEVEFKTAAEDAAQNAKFREKYPTMKKYDPAITVTVGILEDDKEAGLGVPESVTARTQSFNRIAARELGIELEYKVVATSSVYEQKLSAAIAADDMPDMFATGSADMFAKLRDDGALADLTQAYYTLNDTLLENYQKYMPELITSCMKEGGLYALPQQTNKYTTAQRLYIRKDWLEIAGVEMPTSVEELITVGEAFLAHKKEIAAATGVKEENIVPFSIYKDVTFGGSYSAEGLFNACGSSATGAYFTGEDGQLHSSNTSDGSKAALEVLNTMYSKGILDPQFTTISSTQVMNKVSAGYVGIVFGEWWVLKHAVWEVVKSSSVKGADWVWSDLPTYKGQQNYPVVPTMLISGYNLVSSKCAHPEAAAMLANLFYDIYYNDNAEKIYESDVLPSKGFYYQYVPMKIWDGMSSAQEYKRVQSVFENLYEIGLADSEIEKEEDKTGFANRDIFKGGLKKPLTNAQITALEEAKETVYKISANGNSGFYCLDPDVVRTIEKNPTLSAEFNKMRTREKIMHFAEGYPYYVAYRNSVATKDMTADEREGWGIYHEMIDDDGGYAYVVALAEGAKKAKYNEFYGTNLSSMQVYGDYLNTQTSTYYSKFIIGQEPLSKFDTYKNTYNKNGGETIEKQVNAWYQATHTAD